MRRGCPRGGVSESQQLDGIFQAHIISDSCKHKDNEIVGMTVNHFINTHAKQQTQGVELNSKQNESCLYCNCINIRLKLKLVVI